LDIDEKFHLFAKQHNSRWHIRYGEVAPFFTDGYACVAHGQNLAACLSFITGIEMSLRLPLLHAKGFDIRRAWDTTGTGVPLLSNDLLVKAGEIGLPIRLLRYGRDPKESIFLSNLLCEKHENRANIVRLRNNICHGNLNIFVEEKDGIAMVHNSEIEKEAKELEAVVAAWTEGFGKWHTVAEKE
jgi:hypothetical protein